MKISELVNKVEPFRFEFDGEVLEGTYYKYKTTTPKYMRAAAESVPEELLEGTAKQKADAEKERYKVLESVGYQMLADTIATWNAQDDDGNPIPVGPEVFSQLPDSFIEQMNKRFKELREGNPTNGNGSQAG